MGTSSTPDSVQQMRDDLQAIMSECIGEKSLITVEQAMKTWAEEKLPGFTVDKVEIRDGTAYISMSGGE